MNATTEKSDLRAYGKIEWRYTVKAIGFQLMAWEANSTACEALGSEDWRDHNFPFPVPAKASTATSFILVIIMSCIIYPKSGQDRET